MILRKHNSTLLKDSSYGNKYLILYSTNLFIEGNDIL